MLKNSTEEHLLKPSDSVFLQKAFRYLDWPLYLVLVVSGFIHFFLIQTTEFDADQANLLQLAHDTVAHGLIPLSSNLASINILNPPFFVYMLVPAAALSANPLGGTITVALFSVAAAVLVYFFTRRYFGLLPAIVAALLSTTAFNPLKYSRTIWQPNILPFFLVLFLFAIFRGAVDHKKGWFFPAVALVAIIYQLHASSVVALIVLLGIAVVLAPGTIRWKEVGLAVVAVLLLFLPYIILELLNHFADIAGILAFSHLPSQNEMDALLRYQSLFEVYEKFHPKWVQRLTVCLQVLFFGGVGVAIFRLLFPHQFTRPALKKDSYENAVHGDTPRRIRRWDAFRLNPERVAFFLLLAWQIVPFANLIHHSVALHLQYFLLFLPGPFIFIGLSLDELVYQVRRFIPRASVVIQIVAAFVCVLLVGGQLVFSTAYLMSVVSGHYNDRTSQSLPYVNDLGSVWNAAQRADQLAQEKHISRIIVTVDDSNIRPVMTYVGETLKTPNTVLSSNSCLVLPAPGAGPLLYLVGPYASQTATLLHRFTSATLLERPQRLGTKPFRIYLVNPLAPVKRSVPTRNFVNGLALLDSGVQAMPGAGGNTEVTRWSIQRNAPLAPRTSYNYQLNLTPTKGANVATTTCLLNSLRVNDQLLVAFQVPENVPLAPQQQVTGLAYDTVPDTHAFGPIQVTSFTTKKANTLSLTTSTGESTLPLSLKRTP